MDSKINLRIKAKSIRKYLDIDAISQSAVSRIRELDTYILAKHVLLFYPKCYEINLLALLNDDKNFYLPKVCGEKIVICPYKIGDKLVKSCFNVEEPCVESVSADILDLIILPGLMADKEGYRLGYGGGFYDRFLADNPYISTIFPIAKELCIDKLPSEACDVKVNIVVRV